MRRQPHKIWKLGQQFWMAFVVTISAIAIGLTPGYLAEGAYLQAAATAIVFLFVTAIWSVPAVRKVFMESSAKVWKDERAPQCRAVILTVSRLNDFDNEEAPARKLYKQTLQEARAAKSEAEKRQLLDKLCDPEGPLSGWSWQQPLRLLRHNYETLERLCVTVSEEVEKEGQFEAFATLVAALMPQRARVIRRTRPMAIWNYDEVTEALEEAIELVIEELHCRPGDICIDITSGTAAYSAAATVMTLNRDILFSYIQTYGPQVGRVYVYDATIAT